MLNFDLASVAGIEAALSEVCPGGWRRASAEEVSELKRLGLVASWVVDLPYGSYFDESMDHVLVGIDAAFPLSEPRVIAPQLSGADRTPWPHVENDGVLCLKTTAYDADAGQRVLTALQDALDLFTLTKDEVSSEFRREFGSYWAQHSKHAGHNALAYVDLSKGDREVVWWRDPSGRIVFADDSLQLSAWVKNATGKTQETFPRTRFKWLVPAPSPSDYPSTGSDIFDIVGSTELAPHVNEEASLPVLFGIDAGSGHVLACAEIRGNSKDIQRRGFRRSVTLPSSVLIPYFKRFAVERISVDRVDPTWVHGRGVNNDLAILRGKVVCIVGCGAIGGFLARLLAEGGVGGLVLVDSDYLSPPNIARHVLGMGDVGARKARALQKRLLADFPHMELVRVEAARIEALLASETHDLEDVDLIVSAGISLRGDMAIEQWRLGSPEPLPWVCSWTEELAVAGHAVALFGHDQLMSGFDGAGHFKARLTADWPEGVATVAEVGCGNYFQPYGAVELMQTVCMAGRLALDVLLSRALVSCVRSWLGDRDLAVHLGANVALNFDAKFCERQSVWPPSARA